MVFTLSSFCIHFSFLLFFFSTTKRNQTFYDGSNPDFPGICHLPLDQPFCSRTRDCLKEAALSCNLKLHPTGTCITIEGPRFSSKAESLLFKSWGAHVVNMTTVPEVILAKEAGLCYAAVAMATDYDCWHAQEEKVNVELALRTFRENVGKVTKVLCAAISIIAKQDWSETIQELKVRFKKVIKNKALFVTTFLVCFQDTVKGNLMV